MAELQEGQAQAARAQLFDRERYQGPQERHVCINVEKTFGVTGTEAAILQVRPCPWAV